MDGETVMADMSGEVPVQNNRLNVYKYLKEIGRTPKEIAAIMGNISVESPNFDDQLVEKTGRKNKGHGIFQLTSLKKRVYDRHIADKGLPNNYKTQIDFMLDTIYNPNNLSDGILEVKGMEGMEKHDVSGYGDMKDLRKSLIEDPVDVATTNFTKLWEKPKKGKEHFSRRVNHAVDIYNNLTQQKKTGGRIMNQTQLNYNKQRFI